MNALKSDDELEEDMKDEIDSVMGLLDRLKDERKQQLMSSQTDKLSRLEKLKRSRLKETSGIDTTNGNKHMTRIETQVSGNERPPEEPIDVKIRLNRDESRDEQEDDLQEGYREGQQKRKQDTIIAELREKAQIISKSARKGPEGVASALSKTHDIEDDPESAQYLRKIRDANAVEASEDKENKAEKKVERSVVTMDFPTPISPRKTSVTVKLNLDMQKSKIAVARGAGLQGRRKPTTEHIRRSLKLSDDEEPEDVLAAGYEAEHEDMDGEVNAAISPVEANSLESAEPLMFGKPIEAKIMPTSPVEYGQKINLERRGSFEGLIPRSTPKERKPAWKSKTYGGVALPAFAEAMKAGSKSLKKTDTAEKLLTADIVKQAALNKLNKAAKEDKPEKEVETPDWMVEAESRRKHHDRRRKVVKQKPPQPEANGIPIRLKATGSKIFQDETEIQQTTESEPQEDSEKNKFVVKLKPVSKRGNKPTFEPEEAKISFKLKSTGIQLIKPEETPEEPESTSAQSAKLKPTSIEREPEPPRILREEPERPVVPAEVKYFEMVPRTKDIEANKNEEPTMEVRLRQEMVPRTKDIEVNKNDEPTMQVRLRQEMVPRTKDIEVNKNDEPTMQVRLRHVPERNTPFRKASDPSEESELARKLRRRGKALPIHPDEEDKIENQEYRIFSVSGQGTTYSPHLTPRSDYKAVQLEGKYPEKAKIIIPPTRTKAESTPPMSPTRTHAKPFYKVTPLSSKPQRHIHDHSQFTLPQPSTSSRPYESSVPQPSTSSRPYEPSVPQPSTSSRPYESSVPQPSTSSRPYEPSVPQPSTSSRPYESSVPQPSTSSRPYEPSVPQPSTSSRPYESSVPQPSTSSRPYEPSVPQPSTSSRPYESSVPQPSTSSRPYESPVLQPRTPSRPYESPVPQPNISYRPYESPIPQPSTSSRAFSPPPLSPTSKGTVVSNHVDTQPISNKAAVPYKPFKGRRVSGERAKTVTVQAGDIPRIIPGRRSSSSEYPLKATESQVPQKAKAVMMTDRPLDYPYKAEQPGQVLPPWKQDLIERQRTHRYVQRDLGTPDRTMSSGSQSNKENEPRIVMQVEPLWMRELAEKRRNVYNRTQSNGDIQFERIETFERFEKPARSEDSEEEVREKPNFMKEFERKRRSKGRDPQTSEHVYHSSNSSYV